MSANAENEMKKQINRYEPFFKKRYKVLYTVNDFIIGALFFIGSFFFFYDELMSAGIWLFAVGSFLLLIRPTIRRFMIFITESISSVNINKECPLTSLKKRTV